ncbi:SrtB family sortase [Hydrogenoanaerobacterium saccharovorans]|uniref:Sortase, SrtB family n=2 Tax=Hydrogenoanaerobacterium saccharovorans TaxID=474960 RepID=A0A1H7ZNT3_9FIRM|nr:SrtB family sortase [Hydrogenoanaerobacterium saccharovorans]SEM59097.1 sortase, SrtB family [Hydrogenoanaerobacterium saccharovorans]
MRMQYQQPSESNSKNISNHRPRRRKKSFGQRFVENYIPNKNDTKRDLIRKIVLIIAVIVLISSVVYIASYYGESSNNKELNASLQSVWEMGLDEDIKVGKDYPKDFLKRFAPLYEQNKDIRGWIQIDNTQVNYPVMQTDNNKDYDRTDFEKKSNQHGVPFADYRVDLKKPSTNTVIYGHNMTDGQMFGELLNYKSLSFYKEHPIINYDSVYAEGKYKIAAIIVCKADDPDFLYHNFINAEKNAANMTMEQFISKIRERSLINTTVDIKPTDKLVTLSTCDYSFKDPVTNKRIARFVIVGRKVRNGEKATVDVDNAKINPNPVMPKEWTQFIEKQRVEELKAHQESEASKNMAPIREEAKKWFTASELQKITDENLEVELARRKETMSQYLNADELANLSADQKVALLKERQNSVDLTEEARQAIYDNPDLHWMTNDEIDAFAKELAKVNKSQWKALMQKKVSAGDVSIELDVTSFKIMKDDTRTLVAYTDGGSGEVKWSSDKPTVADVKRDGTVVARHKGTAIITATYGGRSATCKVEVTNEEVVETSISLPSSVEVLKGGNLLLTATVTPDDMAERGVTWKITGGTKDAIAISPDGLECMVTGEIEGKTTEVTVTTRDKSKSATVKVAVKAPSEAASISINTTSHTMKIGETLSLRATISPSGTEVKWSASGDAVNIAANGADCTVTATKAGKVTVVAANGKDSTKTAKCTIEITEAAVPEETVTVSPAEVTMEVGKVQTLQLSSGNVKAKSWKSDSAAVSISDSDDVSCTIAADSAGKATITVALSNGKTATCRVTVKEKEVATPPSSSTGGEPSSSDPTPPAVSSKTETPQQQQPQAKTPQQPQSETPA